MSVTCCLNIVLISLPILSDKSSWMVGCFTVYMLHGMKDFKTGFKTKVDPITFIVPKTTLFQVHATFPFIVTAKII
jgi:hypothetical protein